MLAENGEKAKAIQSKFHRTVLWRLRTGRRTPELDTAVKIAEIAGDEAPVDGWLVSAGPPRPNEVARSEGTAEALEGGAP